MGRKRGKREEQDEKRREKTNIKREKKDIRTKNRGMVGQKREIESKKREFCRYDFGKLFQIRQEKAFKIDGTIYTPLIKEIAQ